MRFRWIAALLVLGLPLVPVSAQVQSAGHLNQMIALHEKSLPVFGMTHPAITAGRGGRGRGGAAAEAPPPVDLAAVARETSAYKRADYVYASGASEAFLNYVRELTRAGASASTHPFLAKIPIWARNPESANEALVRQLNAGHSAVMMQAVESPQEVRDVVKAMRFASAGGTRPDTGIALAAAFWGLTPEQYKQKADVWPLNPNGELLIGVIIESLEGLAHLREIVAEPGVGQVWVGYGTLGQVFRGDPDAREAATMQVLAACKELKKPCGFPVNNPTEMEQRMGEGWSVFVMQRRDENAMAAVETGRKLSGRN